jgi:hypothetical protein
METSGTSGTLEQRKSIMNHDDDPKLTLDDNEWRCYKRATRNLRHRQRMERVHEAEPLAWLRAVDWDDDGDPVLAETVHFTDIPVEFVA